MNCLDQKIISLLLNPGRKSELQAVNCLKKCTPKTFGVLIKMNLQDHTERNSIFYHAMAEFIIQVRKGKFLLTGEAKICTYLTEIARRKWLDFSKKIKRQQPPEDYAEPVVEKENDSNEKLKKALQKLNEADRDILVAFYFYDNDLEEYATLNGITYDAAKKRISRARVKLKDFLKPIQK